jgi:hypothetical protein
MPLEGTASDRTWIVRALVCLAPAAFGAYALWLGQDTSWDLRNYHFYNPYALLNGRIGYDVAVAHVATYYNPLMYIPFYWAVASLPPVVVGFLLGLIPGLNLPLLYGIARQVVALATPLRTAGFCLAAAAAGMLAQTVIAETGTSYGDTIVSLPVLAAVWLILRYRERLADSIRRGWPIVAGAGLLVGAALGLKLPFAVYAVGICAAFFGLPLPFRRRFGLAFIFGLGVLAGAALTSGFWMLEMWQRYGSPLFPYFNQYVQSPWGALGSYRDERYIPQNLPMWILFPFWLTYDPIRVGEVGFRDLRFALLYILLAALLLKWAWGRWKRDAAPRVANDSAGRLPATGFFIVLALVCFIVWMKLFGIYRYIVVLEMLAPIASFLILGALLPGRRRQAQAAMACFALLVLTLQPGDWGRRAWSDDYFDFTPLRLPDPAHTVVLMAGHDAMAYMIPFFPPQVRFLRIQGYMTGPSANPNETDRLMRRIIADHTGPLFILYRVYEEWHAEMSLADYRLAMDPGTCITFVPGVEPQQDHDFYFCRVAKLPTTEDAP